VIKTAQTEVDIQACYPVMAELRLHLLEQPFVKQVQMQMQLGYQLSYIEQNENVVAVAGHRVSHNLAWGKFMYVDDLVTASTERSKGHGKQLLAWLVDYARQQACQQFHLDSGTQRKDAHRFYEREGLRNMGHHYSIEL